MNTVSVFSGVCLFFACALVGVWVKRRFMKRATFYEDYYHYLGFALEKISYERMPIKEIKASFSKGEKSEFCRLLLGEESAPPILEKEISEVKTYLSEIGTTDADTQIASLNGKCAEMKRFCDQQCVKYRKDGSLYFKLCVLLGVVAFILIV